jgi:hypothetical protein
MDSNSPRQNDDKPADPQNESPEKDQRSHINPSIPAEVKPPPKNPNEPCHCRYEPTPRWWRIFEGLGILAVIVYSVITWWMWRDSNHNFTVNERAWVGPSDIMRLYIVNDEAPGIQAFADYSIKNFGHGPALKVNSKGQFIIGFEGPGQEQAAHRELDRIAQTVCADTLAATSSLGMTVFPEQIFTMVHTPSTSGGEIIFRSGASPIKKLWFIGCVTYRDQFGTSHWSRFCFTTSGEGPITPSEDLPWRYSHLYNDTDEEQKH